jgi:hypothetical protein
MNIFVLKHCTTNNHVSKSCKIYKSSPVIISFLQEPLITNCRPIHVSPFYLRIHISYYNFMTCFELLYSSLELDSAVGMATGYGLDNGGVGVQVPVGSRISLFHIVQTSSRANPASYPMGTGRSFPGGKAAGA